jgi:hypothetical protein
VAAADKFIMSTTDLPVTDSPPATSPLLPVLTAAIFLSAALLFAVQPMFTKMVLPRLGGAPQVWSVAMVFFQAALLAATPTPTGSRATRRPAVAVHSARRDGRRLLLLPLSIASGWGTPAGRRERSGCWAVRVSIGCRSSRSPPTAAAASLVRAQRSSGAKDPISSTPPAMSEASSHCCPIR